MKNIIGKILFAVFFLLMPVTIFCEGIGTLEIGSINNSDSTSAVCPGEYAVDGNENTSWTLDYGESSGWAELEFSGMSGIYGVGIAGRLEAGDELVIEYDADGIWTIFSGGSIKELDAEDLYLDVSADDVVTDKIRICLSKKQVSSAYITEINVIGESNKDRYRKIDIDSVIGQDESIFHPLSNITDGNTRTYWKSEFASGFFPLIDSSKEWLTDFFQKMECNRQSNRSRWNDDEGIILKLKDESTVYRLKVYLEKDYTGDIAFKCSQNGRWSDIGSFDEGLEAGWHTIDFEDGIETDSIKITISESWNNRGHGWNPGGIGEVELWGVNNTEAGPESVLSLANVDLSSTLNKQFVVDESKDYRIRLLLNKDLGTDLQIDINGTGVFLGKALNINDSYSYETVIGSDILWDGVNFIRIPSQDGAPVIIRAGITEVSDNGVLGCRDGVPEYFAGNYSGYKDIEFNEELSLENITLYSDELRNESLYYEYDQQWFPLYWNGEYKNAKRFSTNYQYSGNKQNIKAAAIRISNLTAGVKYGIKVEGSLVTDRAPEIKMYWPKTGEVPDINGFGRSFIIGWVDNENAVVTINGTVTMQHGNIFWLPNMPDRFINNDHELTVTATDEEGRIFEKTIVWYDRDSSRYSVNLPDEISYTLDNTLRVQGRANRNINVYVNGEEAENRRNNYSKDVELEPGLNLIVIKFVQEHRGIVAMLQRRVVLVTSEPEIKITNPDDNFYSSEQSLTVSGTFDVMGGYEISSARQSVTVTGNHFKISGVTLHDGINEIKVILRDQFGRTATDGITVSCDTQAPVITGVNPESGSLLSESVNTLIISLEDDSAVTVFFDGLVVPGGDGVFEKTVSLPDGFLTIPLTVKDKAGNITSINLDYVVDTVPPAMFDINVNPAGWTSDTQPVISFNTTDAVSGVDHYELSIDSEDFYTIESPYKLPVLEDGVHEIIVRAVDAAGHMRSSGAYTMIDTIPPVVLEDIEIVPGNGQLTLKWEDGDDDVTAYEITRSPEWESGEQMRLVRSEDSQEYLDTEVENGSNYSYMIRAVDRAENKGDFSIMCSAIPGIETESILESDVTKVEYETAVLYMKGESLPEDASSIRIAQVSKEWQDEADDLFEHDFAGAAYDFSLLDGSGNKTSGGEIFNEPFIGIIDYDPQLIPAGFPEENISVFTFDRRWGRWTRLENCAVDTENKKVVFTSNHFSIYAPAATSVEDIAPEEVADAGYSPFGTYVNHEGFTVSPQGGNAHTSVTELVLSGPNGFDFELKRYYDLTVAKMDTRAKIPAWAIKYLENQGDYAYSMGRGWRLNLPYIKNAASDQYLVMPDGSMFGFKSLDIKNLVIADSGRNFDLENHSGEHFSLSVSQTKESDEIYFIGAGGVVEHYWLNTAFSLVLSNGITYTFDSKGRTTAITSQDGMFSVNVNYVDNGYEISTIIDAVGRTINFEYTEISNDIAVPYITKISLADDPYKRSISYTQDDGYLSGAKDAGGRTWQYSYDNEYYVGGSASPVPFNLTDALEDYSNKTDLYELIGDLEEPVSYYTYKPLYSIEGPGKGRIEATYGCVSPTDTGEYARVLTRQITIFDDHSAVDNDSVRATWYDYKFTDAGEELGYYLSETTVDELNDKRFTKYSYGYRMLVDTYWSEDDEGDVNVEKVFEKESAGNRISNTGWYEKINNDVGNLSLLKSKTSTYKADTDINPLTETVRHGSGSDYTRMSYAYDDWGNRQMIEEENSSSGRIRKVITYRYYSSGSTVKDASFKDYTSSGLVNGDIPDRIKNHIIQEEKVNYTPSINPDGTASTGAGTAVNQYTYYSYDSNGRITGKSVWDSSGNRWNKTAYSWNANGDLASVKAADDHITEYTYDAFHYPASKIEKAVVDADGNIFDVPWSYDYDWAGWKISETDPRLFATVTAYDKLGRVITRVEPGDAGGSYSINVSYNDNPGSLSSIMTDSLGRKIERKYNDLGQMIKQSSWLDSNKAATVELSYNRWGNVVKMINPNSGMDNAGEPYEYITYYSYDALGRMQQIEYPYESDTDAVGNPSKTMDFNYSSNLLTITDEEGAVTTELHDMRGNVIRRSRVVNGQTITTNYWYDGIGNLLAQEGPSVNAVTTNTYNSLNQVVNTLQPSEDFYENGSIVEFRPRIEYFYDDMGRQEIKSMQAPDGDSRSVKTTYDALGRQINITKKNNNDVLSSESFYFDLMGNIFRKVDANGLETGYSYSPRNNILTETDPEGGITSYEYYEDGLLKSTIDPRGNSGRYGSMDFRVDYFYDNLKRLISAELPAKETDGERLTVNFKYDLVGNMIEQTGVDGLITANEFTPRRWLKKQTVSGDNKSYITENEYDYKGNLVRTTDPRGQRTVMAYDEAGQLIYRRTAEDNITRYDYDEAGNQTESVWYKDGEAIAARFEYDSYSRLKTEFLPVEAGSISADIEKAMYYDRFGNLTKDTDALGNSNYYSYDELNRLISETNDAGFNKSYKYDDGGRLIESTDAGGNISSYSYDGRGLLLRRNITGDNGNKSVSYSYDEAGALEWSSDDGIFTGYNGAGDSYVPDVYGRVTSVETRVDGLSLNTNYNYNISDRITGITAPDGNKVVYDYNLLGELLDVEGYLSGSPVYDDGGLTTSITAANGVALNIDYDGEGRINNRSFIGRRESNTKEYSISYDEAGNVSSINNPEGKQNTYSYDARNRLVSAWLRESFGIDPGNTTNQETLLIEADDVTGDGVLEEVESAEISLDFAAGSIGVNLNGSYKVARIFLSPETADNRVKEEHLRVFLSNDNTEGSYIEQEGFSINKSADGVFEIILTRPVEAAYVKVMTDFNERDLSFNPVDKSGFKGASEDIIKVYHYLSLRVEQYAYDKAGNRTNEEILYNGSEFTGENNVSKYYPKTNRILTDGRYAYKYDANGNITAKGTAVYISGSATPVELINDWSIFTDSTSSIDFSNTGELWEYQYDSLNRLIRVSKNGEEVASYTYNADGLRIKKEKDGESKYYIFDLNGNVLYEESSDESYTKYVYIKNTRFAREDGSTDGSTEVTRYYYHTDHLGSTVMITDSEANVVWDVEYTPFGELNDPYKKSEGMVQFTGKDMDLDTGLYYYNARWYDPQIGRFTTEDPIRAGLNYFIYANNNPLKYVDPTGLIAIQGAEATTGHIDIDIDTGTPVEISAREASVKGDFPYMKGYGLLDQEISDYSELGDLKNEMAQYEGLGGADGAYYSDLKSQYDTKLNDSLHLQKELNPDGSDACAYRTAQAGIEVGLGRPMPLDMINKSTTDIRHKGLSMTTLSGTRPGSEYNVDNFRAVMDSALNSLGRGDLRSQLGSSNNAEWSFNIAKGRTANNGIHFNLANSGKNHVWDSMTGSTNYISSESRYIPFSVISR